ncbi:hypothetical protein HA402_011607 [Bradysia odoriphaga]|nr:hypothetical protein HA402_011607 [Bradysia odoriphaga]
MGEISWLDILSTAAVTTTVLQFLTGSLVCHKYIQKKSTGDSSGFPFICGFLSCSLWLTYGKLTNERSVVIVNTIGSMLFLLYTVIYYVFTVSKSSFLKQFFLALLTLLLTLGYVQYETDFDQARQVMGLLCCSVSVLFFAAPLTMLLHVVRIKNVESLPFPLILSNFFVSLEWFIYGCLIKDDFLQITNFLGGILSGAQLLLFLIYPSRMNYGGPIYKPLDQSNIF